MDTKDIEKQIRDKKNEIKNANRELSNLQKELKKDKKPFYVKVKSVKVDNDLWAGYDDSEMKSNNSYIVTFHIVASSFLTVEFIEKIKKTIESFCEGHGDDKSYVDWNKIPSQYNWVAVDGDGQKPGNGMYSSKPKINRLGNRFWSNKKDYGAIPENAFIGTPPAWDKSLIHRPGVEE